MMESIVWVIWTAQGTDKHLDPANLIESQHCAVIKVNSVSPTLSIPHREVRCSGFVVRLSHAVPHTNWWTHWSRRFCNWNSVKLHLSKYSRISPVCSDLAVFPEQSLSSSMHMLIEAQTMSLEGSVLSAEAVTADLCMSCSINVPVALWPALITCGFISIRQALLFAPAPSFCPAGQKFKANRGAFLTSELSMWP